MANRYTRQFTAANIPGVTHVFSQITFGGGGAGTINTGGSYITAITHNGTGDYTLTLADAWNALLGGSAVFNAGSSAPAAPIMSVKTNSVASKSLRVLFLDYAGSVADPASGEILYLDIKLKNSSVTY
jgi:hypothetical protein